MNEDSKENQVRTDRQQNGEEKGPFQEFVSSALRLHRRGSYENLLCQHLIMAVNADPLRKVRLICEAAWMISNQEKLKLDSQLTETIYTLSLSFLNTNLQGDFVGIAWGFDSTQESYERFISPWRQRSPLSYRAWTTGDREDKNELIDKAESRAEVFFLFTNSLNLSPSTFQMLKSEFLRWSIPLTMEVFEKLSRLVQPDLYKEMLQTMMKREDVQ